MTEIPGRVAESIRRSGAAPGDRWGVAVSGGADSMALLHVLAGTHLRLHVLHVDHRLRAGSGEDAASVVEVANSLGLPWTVLRVSVPRDRRSLEEAARDVRSAVLSKAAHALGLQAVATGHTLDDQAETVLLRLFRGTGARGMGGIREVRRPFVRPLLTIRRCEIEAWLTVRGIAWLQDQSNVDARFDRNWVRTALLPLVAERFPGAVSSLARHASLAADDEEVLAALAEEQVASAWRLPGIWVLPDAAFQAPAAVVTRSVRRLIEEIGGRIDMATVRRVMDLLGSATGSAVVCGPESAIQRTAGGVAFLRTDQPEPDPVELPDRGVIVAEGWGLKMRVGHAEDPWGWRCRLDAVRAGLRIRGRLPGDRVPTAVGSRKVQDVLVDAKVPRFLRDRVAVLADGDEVLAVVGLTSPPAATGHVVVDAEPIEGVAWWTDSRPGIW